MNSCSTHIFAERNIIFEVNDGGTTGFMRISNSASSGEFAPTIWSHSNSTGNPGLRIRSVLNAVANDSGSVPVLVFDVRIGATSNPVINRPIYQWSNDGVVKMTMAANGNLGIGTDNPGFKLDVQNGNSNTININTNGSIQAAGTVYTSDEMFKTNIDSIQSALAIIDALKPKTYYFDTLNYNGEGKFNFESVRQYGFIAQEVEMILPELVSTSTKPAVADTLGNTLVEAYDYRALNYIGLISILTKGIQELQFENDGLNTTLQNQQFQINQLVESDEAMTNQLMQFMSIINDCCNNADGAYRMSGTEEDGSAQTNVILKDAQSIVLEQNVPNPFAERTVVNYFIPKGSPKAEILFHDSRGRLVRSVEILNSGKGQINVFASDLSRGTYSYSLVIDGRIVESKKMIKID